MLIVFTSLSNTLFSQGKIAYIKNENQIRTIHPDGSNDKLLWTHKDAKPNMGLFDLAWSPDGKQLAFSSAHAAAASVYHADIFLINADGSGYRKLTNAPLHEHLNKYPKGSVTVTVRNNQYSFQTSNASSGVFMVYIVGADLPQQITLPPGSAKTITFKNVADFGKKAQAIVVMSGKFRWFMPGTDVVAGKTIKAPDMLVSGDGIDMFGAFRPVWKSDGSRISFRNGMCMISSVPLTIADGDFIHDPMFADKQPFGACTWDWGPTKETVDQVIYTDNNGDASSIYLLKEKGKHPGQFLTQFANIQYQILQDLHWLPDGSGLLYSTPNLFRDASNIYKYDLKTKKTTQVTKLNGSFARNFSVSPDGQWIVFERAPTLNEYRNIDLWMIKTDGSSMKLLIKDAQNPSWGK